MGRIRVLDDPLIDRIAAGEVVERPASVVKELVENSLDAGAGAIEVQLRAGGRERIRVVDDGRGMDRDDAVLATKRHATSKLASVNDLESIETLGFRGEALATIAAVSHFTLRSAATDGEGTEVEIVGGRVEEVRSVGMPRGSSVQVDRLFFNTPARRKFLRRESTELSHCLRWLSRYAVAHPGLRVQLSHGQRRLIDLAPASDLAERVAQIHGDEFVAKLIPFDLENDGIRVHGLAGRPVDGLTRRDAQHYFVNGRVVQDRVLSHATTQAYSNTMPAGRYPALFVTLELAPELVDVNVHPQKTEVRFGPSGQVHDLLRAALLGAIGRGGVVPSLSDLRPTAVPAHADAVRDATRAYLDSRPTGATVPAAFPGGAGHPSGSQPAGPPADRPGPMGLTPVSEAPRETVTERRPQALAQFRDSYIVADDPEGLVLVDQHAAHERVLFERYLAAAERNQVEVQRLLFPVNVELPPHERATLEGETEEFARLGFLLEPFGGETVRVDGVPAVAGALDPSALLRELVGLAGESRSTLGDVSELRHRRITTAACHAAIKVHHSLALPAMQQLLDDLFETANPTTCPHGRPVLFRLTFDEVERAFRRR